MRPHRLGVDALPRGWRITRLGNEEPHALVRWGKGQGCAGKQGLQQGVIRSGVCEGCQRPRVRADGSGVNSGRVDGARLCRLQGKVAEGRGCRARVRCHNHVYRGVSMEGTDRFAPGIPACFEGGELRFVACGFVGCPPVPDLLIPTLCLSGAADTNMRSPYGGMSMGVHRDLLDCLSTAVFCRLLWCAVRSTNRLIDNIIPYDAKIQRIVII